MSDNTSKKRPDFIAYAVRPQPNDAGPKYTRIGVGFNLKNGGISVLYDATPLSGQIVLLGLDQEEKPTAISYGSPVRKPSFEVSMVRDGQGDNSYWTEVGSAWRQEGYVRIQLEVVPTRGQDHPDPAEGTRITQPGRSRPPHHLKGITIMKAQQHHDTPTPATASTTASTSGKDMDDEERPGNSHHELQPQRPPARPGVR